MKDDVDQMKSKFKSVLLTFMLLATVFVLCACSNAENPYDVNNAEGYTVSVKFDANGGAFTTNTSVIMDSFNISGMRTNSSGKVELALLAPDDPARGASEAFTASNAGYFLAGWYSQRTQSTDSEGNIVYSYSGRWDFANDLLEVDPNGTYSSEEPVVTLYAAWVPMFEINFYALGSEELIGTYTYNPLTVGEVKVPQWNEETGTVDMYKFTKRSGYTFNGAYYDAAGTVSCLDTVEHVGSVDLATGTANATSMGVYVDWLEGNWYHISTPQQLLDNVDPNGHYVLCADLDFTDVLWPSLFGFGNFSGEIQGNGHAIRNVTVTQTSKNSATGGLFGTLTESAVIRDVTFENITYSLYAQITKGTPSYGIFAGTIRNGAVMENVTLASGTMEISSESIFSVQYAIGLVCGTGDTTGITYDLGTLSAAAAGDKPESVQISIDGERITFVIE